MEYIITGLSVTAMMGSVSAITTLANGVYSLSDRIIKSTDSGIMDIKRLVEASDLKNRIRIMDIFVREIDISNKNNKNSSNKTPRSIIECIESIKKSVKDIEAELKDIQSRIDYNDNLYFTIGGTRAYKFNNSYKRLDAKIKTLNSRYETLRTLFSMRHLLNPDQIQQKIGYDNDSNKLELKLGMIEDIDCISDNKIVDNIMNYKADPDQFEKIDQK